MPTIGRNGKSLYVCRSCRRQVGHWRQEADGWHFMPLPTTIVRYRTDGTLVLRCMCGEKSELKPRSEAA